MIIESLLDIDMYKLSMAQLVFFKHRDVEVEYTFNNRTSTVNLLEYIDLETLEKELSHVTTLKITDVEIKYLESTNLFTWDFLSFLSNLRLPMVDVRRSIPFNSYDISVKGKWCDVILWETIILSIVNELYHKSQLHDITVIENTFTVGMERLYNKIDKLTSGQTRYGFTEFGTRRRFSRFWQEIVVTILKREHNIRPGGIGFNGTSNVHLAMKLNIPCVGTFAHEMPMVYSGIYNDDLVGSHRKMLEDWYEFYGETLSIALTDTYGSKYFFEDFTTEQARKWKGFRQDSGDPFKFGEQAEAFYIKNMVNPKEKLVVFSDGLNVDKIISLGDTFKDRLLTSFGWGSNLVCDVGQKVNLSIVVKATMSNGHGTVKLSDNLNKALGSPKNIERFKKEFRYTNVEKQELLN